MKTKQRYESRLFKVAGRQLARQISRDHKLENGWKNKLSKDTCMRLRVVSINHCFQHGSTINNDPTYKRVVRVAGDIVVQNVKKELRKNPSEVKTIAHYVGLMGSLSTTYYDGESTCCFDAIGEIKIERVLLDVSSPVAIPFEVFSKAEDGTIRVVASGLMPADTLESNQTGSGLTKVTILNLDPNTRYGVRVAGGLVASTICRGLYVIPSPFRKTLGNATGFSVELTMNIHKSVFLLKLAKIKYLYSDPNGRIVNVSDCDMIINI